MNVALWTRRSRTLAAVAIAWAAVVSFILAPNLTRLISEPSGGKPQSVPSATSPLASQLAGLHLMDYYPSDAAWTYMWTKWNPTHIDDDFTKIKAIGANSVRLNIEPSTFGYPQPTTAMTDELAAAIKSAAAHDLTVQLTLFDWWSAFTDTSGSDQWVKALLAPYRSDSEISFIDVKNEIEPSDSSAMTWLEHELPVVKQVVGRVPVTVSVTGPSILGNLASVRKQLTGEQPDFYDIHYYDQAEHALATFQQAKSLVSPLPLFIGETGKTTGNAPPNIADEQQDLYLRSVEWAAQTAGLPNAAPWIFQDIESAAVPSNASESDGELDYGLYTVSGDPKPSATSVKALFQHGSIPPGINGDFLVGKGTDVADWTPVRANNDAVLAWDATVGHDAAGSVRLSHTGTSADGNPAYVATPVVQPTSAGQTFEMTAWAKGDDATGENRIAICWFDANDNYLSETDSPVLPSGTTDWQWLTVTSKSPKGAAYELIYLKSGGNTGTVYFDDATFAEEG